MRGELGAIEADWPALRWSIGGVISLLVHVGIPALLARLRPLPEPLSSQPARAEGVVAMEAFAGALVAGAIVAAVVVGDLIVLQISWRQFARLPIGERLLLVAAVEAAFVWCAMVLPRRRRPLAAGMVLCGMMLLLHVAAHG